MTKTFQKVFSSLLILALALALMPPQFSVSASASELFISEYGEGSSYNKYIEIYNGTGGAVDLSSYEVWRISNGGTWPEATIALTGTLDDGQVLVVYNPSADATIAAAGDLQISSGNISHNGDDAVGLAKNSVLFDAVGADGDDPGDGWDVAGTTNATVDHVLVRKSAVCSPNTDWDVSRGTSPADSEWVVLDNEDWSNIGVHTADCNGVVDTAPTVISTTPSDSATDVALDANVEISFSEGVTVSSSWFDISCTSSGAHTAVESGGPTTFVLDPDTDFANSETCTVTVFAAQVTDQDAEDPPDNMDADYMFSFDTVSDATAANLVINEIDYDQPSTDTAEFVEIYNNDSNSVDLSDYSVQMINGTGGGASEYRLFALPATNLAPGDYFVLCGDAGNTPNCDMDVAPDTNLIQNGAPDAVALLYGSSIIDTVSYEGDTGAPYTEGSGVGLEDPGTTSSNYLGISRFPDGVDTNQNNVDFDTRCITPGAANTDASSDCVASEAQLLLLSELVVTPTGGEFIEIYNPNSSAFDLSDVYLTDATFAGGGTYYYNIVTGANAGGGSYSDFNARFPDGASIGPGEYQTVSLPGSDDFFATYGMNPTYELFEDGVSADGVPDMREASPGSINNQGGLTNGGEVVILYQWDGASDLVTDLDYAVWGDKAEAVDKTGVSIDGPDADTVASAYLDDTAIVSQDVVASAAHDTGDSWQRDDLTEGAEVTAGGNGAAGHDETSEDLSNTWCVGASTPNAATECTPPPPILTCEGSYTFTPIHDIQGSGTTTPLGNQEVIIEGIVVGDFQADDSDATDLAGFYVQEEDSQADADPLTSEGLFVYDLGSTVDVSAGDLVRVLGTVDEFQEQTQVNATSGAVVVCDSGQSGLVSTTAIPFPLTNGQSDLEQYEGMLVTTGQPMTVIEYFNLDRFGTVDVATERLETPTDAAEPGPDSDAVLAYNNARRIRLDDGSQTQNPYPVTLPDGQLDYSDAFGGGDTLTDIVGVLSWIRPYASSSSSPDAYAIQLTQLPFFSDTNPRPAAPPAVGGNVKVTGFNVLNYFNGDGMGGGFPTSRGADDPAELQKQTDKIVAALSALDADVFGLIEIENDFADGANSAIADLVAALNAVSGSGTYAYVDPGANVGTDEITAAIIYKPAAVSPMGSLAVLDSQDFVNPFNAPTDRNRPALAQTFIDHTNGGVFTVVVNHLKSKGSSCGSGDDDPRQGNCNGTRAAAAQVLVDWLATNPTGVDDPDFLLIGDYNSYAQEDPIGVLAEADYVDLFALLQPDDVYSYVFDGQTGYLDYGLASASLVNQVTGAAPWNINSDEPDAFEYNEDFDNPANLPLWYAPTAYRSSDHDPVVVGLNLEISPRSAKQYVLDSLIELRATVPSGRDARKLDEAIKHLTKSLTPSLWVDEKHVDVRHGQRVFKEEKNAVNKLEDILKNRRSTISKETLQKYIDILVSADRMLAQVAIDDAIAQSGNSRYITKAITALARGDKFVAIGKIEAAMEQYRNAWKFATYIHPFRKHHR